MRSGCPFSDSRSAASPLPSSFLVVRDQLFQRFEGEFLLLAVFQEQQRLFLEDVDFFQRLPALWGFDHGAHIREFLRELGVKFPLVEKAAHEAAAAPGQLGGVEGELLVLRELGDDRLEFAEKRLAAQPPAAHADSSDPLRLVPNPDLSQFDARAVLAGQVPDQGLEIHSFFGREEEGDFVPVELVLDVDQLHVQSVFVDTLPAVEERFAFEFLVFIRLVEVLQRRLPDDHRERDHRLSGRPERPCSRRGRNPPPSPPER
ncbi:MAG: hypothetical protein MZV64_02780 [Ignavibacteriales bacterium]|nr:hypothetical protein [Ignavibacteriales bacterium]